MCLAKVVAYVRVPSDDARANNNWLFIMQGSSSEGVLNALEDLWNRLLATTPERVNGEFCCVGALEYGADEKVQRWSSTRRIGSCGNRRLDWVVLEGGGERSEVKGLVGGG